MGIKELFAHRTALLDESVNDDGFISDSSFLARSMQYLNETKLTDTDDVNESYCLAIAEYQQIKINGYIINESGERLQLFIVNEESLSPSAPEDELVVSQRQVYDKLFSKALNFVRRSVRGQLEDHLQDSSPAKGLSISLGSPEYLDQIDVVEVFLLSATVTAETRGEEPTPRKMEFEEETIPITWVVDKVKYQKDLIVIRRLIDMNFLYNVAVSQGNREPLTVDFSGYPVECIQAATEANYESYLCVLPAPLLADLYRRHSSRMLEKNVRSFLQLNNSVNKGIQDTIRNNPEKFVAYNNGLTITATGKDFYTEKEKIYIRSLTDFQIVNGGQTTATIYFSGKLGLDISRVRVVAKINVARNASEEELEDLITRISAYSNAQSKVSSVDLRSRNSQLIRLKTLSESVLTPSGSKWFFERARGEFNTMVRKSPNDKNKLNREYPKERRFTKEELAKYYVAWGETPWLVKKGGEKVFRLFIEMIAELTIDRAFYEETIAKVVLFKSFEKLHGAGHGAIGQLRSAVVPYALSVLFKYTEGLDFRLSDIWKKEGLDEDFSDMAYQLMQLVNDLVKSCAGSDDYGEYSKKQELWNKIRGHQEVVNFVYGAGFQGVVSRYCGEGGAAARRSLTVVRGTVGRPKLGRPVGSVKSAGHKSGRKPGRPPGRPRANGKANGLLVDFQPTYNNVRFFDTVDNDKDSSLIKALDFIVRRYEQAVNNGKNVLSEFSAIRKEAAAKGAKHASVFPKIGKLLKDGIPPDVEQVQKAASYTDLLKR